MRRKFALIITTILFLTACFVGCTKKGEVNPPKEDIQLGNVLIFGDSYSTFTNHIPDGYKSWYAPTASYTDVNDVKETWWRQLVDRTYSSLLLNSSYSGSTICHTGYDGADVADTSFVGRMTALFAQADFEKEGVNTVIIYGGLNDYWANAPFGELKYEDFTAEDLYSVYPAFTYLLSTIKHDLPSARILVIIEELLGQEMKENFALACEQLSVEYILPQNISKRNSHPDLRGMDQLTDQIIAYLKANSI